MNEVLQENATIDKPFVEKNNLVRVIGLLILIGRSPGAKELKPGQSDVLDSLHEMIKFKGKVRSFMASNKVEIGKLVNALRVNSSLIKLISSVLSKKGLLGKGGVLGIFEDFGEIKSRKRKLHQISIRLDKFLSIDQLKLLDSIYNIAVYGVIAKPIPPEFAFNTQIRAKQNELDILLKQIEDLRMSLVAEAIRTGNHNARILLSEVISDEDYNAMIDLNLGDPRWKKLWKRLLLKYHTDKALAKGDSPEEADQDSAAINAWADAMKDRSYPGLDTAKKYLRQRTAAATASTAGSSYDSSGYEEPNYGYQGYEEPSSTPRDPYDHDSNYDWFSDPYYADNPWKENLFRFIFNRAPNWNDWGDRVGFENEYEKRKNFYNQHGRYPEDPEPQPEPEYQQQDYSQQDSTQYDYDWSSTQYNTPQDEKARKTILDMLKKAGLVTIIPPAYVIIGFLWLMYHMGAPDWHRLFNKKPQLIKVLYKKLVDLNVAPESPADIPKAMYNVISSLVMKVVKSELTKTLISGLGVALMTIPNGVMSVLQKIISQMTLKNLSKLDPRKFKQLYDKLVEKIPSGADIKNLSKEKINSLIKFVTPEPKKDQDLSEKDIAKQVEKIAKAVTDKSKLMKQFQDHLEQSVTDGELTTKQAVKLAKEHLAKLDVMISNAQSRLKELSSLMQVHQARQRTADYARQGAEQDKADAEKKQRSSQAKKSVRKKFGKKFDAKFESVAS